MFNFVIKILSTEIIIALFDAGATCSCISYQLFIKNSDRVDVTHKSLKVNTGGGTTLGPIGIAHLELNIHDHVFVHNFII